jgi:hypothetical protein
VARRGGGGIEGQAGDQVSAPGAATGRRVVFKAFSPADDVLVTFAFDQAAVDVIIKTLPPYARNFDPGAKVWRIHPAYANRLAVVLTRLGFDVVTDGRATTPKW